MPLQLINQSLFPPPPKPPKCPLLAQIRKKLKICRSSNSSSVLINKLGKASRKLSRIHVKSLQVQSYLTFNTIISKKPSKAFKAIRKTKKGNIKNITTLTIGKVTYKGNCVKDGFYDSLSALKNPPLPLVMVILTWTTS